MPGYLVCLSSISYVSLVIAFVYKRGLLINTVRTPALLGVRGSKFEVRTPNSDPFQNSDPFRSLHVIGFGLLHAAELTPIRNTGTGVNKRSKQSNTGTGVSKPE